MLLKTKIIAFSFIIFSFSVFSKNPSDTLDQKPFVSKSKVFGNIYSAFYYGLNANVSPRAAFEFTTGLLGYSTQISPNVKATLIYDVTRTTNFNYLDTIGISNYFEGSKYTAFLKMAEMKWDISEMFIFRVGQLLNTQYLTYIDKFWGYRYIDVTFQEKYRFGMPADFGAQIDFKYRDKFLNQLSLVNGEGPFRHQDNDAQFIISNNLQLTPTEELIIKLYIDYGPTADTSSASGSRSAISLFFGYKSEKYKIGGEYNYVKNYAWLVNNDYSGTSIYGGFEIDDKNELLVRYDYIQKATGISDGHYLIFGYQYQPVKMFFTSVNIRHSVPSDATQLYFSFGIKF